MKPPTFQFERARGAVAWGGPSAREWGANGVGGGSWPH